MIDMILLMMITLTMLLMMMMTMLMMMTLLTVQMMVLPGWTRRVTRAASRGRAREPVQHRCCHPLSCLLSKNCEGCSILFKNHCNAFEVDLRY